MKKILASILSLSMVISMFTAASAAVGELNDPCTDSSKMFGTSSNIVFETKDKLGSYQNPDYATSDVGKLEVVYQFEDFASFEVQTLNYKDYEDIKFYASKSEKGTYEEITDFSKTTEVLNTSWDKNIYFAGVDEGYNYFKIVINQEKAKYIRLDNVKLIQDIDLELVGAHFYSDDDEVTDGNMYGVNKLVLEFNQRVETAGLLSIKNDDTVDCTAKSQISEDGMKITYTFDALEFNSYEFRTEPSKTATEKKYSYSKTNGAAPKTNISNNMHFEYKWVVEDFLTGIVGVDGKEVMPGEYELVSSNEDVIKIEDGKIVAKKAGTAVLSAEIDFGGKTVKIQKEVTVCGAKALEVTPESIEMKVGEEKELDVVLELDDTAKIIPEDVEIKAVEEGIVSIDGFKIKAVKNGATYVKVSVDYNGQIIEKNISVGVGEEARDILAEVGIDVNRDSLYVGESEYTVLKYSFENSGEMDVMATDVNYFSSNEKVLSIDNEGKITANAAGNAKIWAEVSLDGIKVTSDKITVTVEKNTIDRALICFETTGMCVGESREISVKAYNKTGEQIENPKVKYTLSNGNFTISGNTLKAAKAGNATIYATVESDGASVKTATYDLLAKEFLNETTKSFNKKNDWSGTFEHSDALLINASLGMIAADIDSPAQYVTFETEDQLIGFSADVTFASERKSGDLTVCISEDNVNYQSIEEDKITVNETSSNKYTYSMSSTDLSKAKYVKLVLDKQDGSKQDIRLNSFTMIYNKKPEVINVVTFSKNGEISNKDVVKIAVSYSQDIEEGFDGVTIDGVDIKCSVDGNLLIIEFDELDTGSYALNVAKIQNKFGLKSDNFGEVLELEKPGIVVKKLGNNEVEVCNNYDESKTFCIIWCAYDSDGNLIGMYVENNFTLANGSNKNVACGKSFANADEVKVYVWEDLKNMFAY